MTLNQLVEEVKKQVPMTGQSLNQFNYKRLSFEHEKELRLYFIDMPIPHAIKGGIPRHPLEYKKIDIDLKELVEEIVIAPFADDWFDELVKKLIEKLGFNFRVTRSDLYKL